MTDQLHHQALYLPVPTLIIAGTQPSKFPSLLKSVRYRGLMRRPEPTSTLFERSEKCLRQQGIPLCAGIPLSSIDVAYG